MLDFSLTVEICPNAFEGKALNFASQNRLIGLCAAPTVCGGSFCRDSGQVNKVIIPYYKD